MMTDKLAELMRYRDVGTARYVPDDRTDLRRLKVQRQLDESGHGVVRLSWQVLREGEWIDRRSFVLPSGTAAVVLDADLLP